MFSEESLKIIETIDKHVSEMNNKIEHPYFFSWSLPTNHRHVEVTEISYFCVNLGKYLIQETETTVERCLPVKIMFFFGQAHNLEHCTVPENIANFWISRFSDLLHKNYLALDNAARGFHNPNNSEKKY